MNVNVNDAIREIEQALEGVQTTLDALRAGGQDEAAFEIARLQFSASIRASWPGNLLPLADALERAAPKLDGEKAEIARRSAATFRKVVG